MDLSKANSVKAIYYPFNNKLLIPLREKLQVSSVLIFNHSTALYNLIQMKQQKRSKDKLGFHKAVISIVVKCLMIDSRLCQ